MRLLHILPLLVIPASIFACASSGNVDEGAAQSSNAITGSLANLQACSAVSTYDSDGPNDFDVPAAKDIPPKITQTVGEYFEGSVGHYKAPSVGDVYVVSGTAHAEGFIMLFDRNGAALASGIQYGTTRDITWLTGAQQQLDCSGTPYNVPGTGSTSSSSGFSSSGYNGDCDGGAVWYDDAGDVTATSCGSSSGSGH